MNLNQTTNVITAAGLTIGAASCSPCLKRSFGTVRVAWSRCCPSIIEFSIHASAMKETKPVMNEVKLA
jgi:hypothetical protein